MNQKFKRLKITEKDFCDDIEGYIKRLKTGDCEKLLIHDAEGTLKSIITRYAISKL